MEKKIKKIFFNCPICGSSHFFKIYGISVFDVCLCRFCGLVCLNPRMDEKGYMEGFIKNYRKDLFGDYLADSVDPDKPYGKVIESPGPKKVFNDLKSYLSNEAKILDVGCGYGEVLILFKQNGFNNLTGIDPIPEYYQRFKKFYDIEYYNKSLSEFAGTINKEKKFDCIILNHVIEHFVEPDKSLETINNLMSENGILYIRTPDLYKFSKPFSQFCIPHTFYFSRTTLENLLKKCGFKVKRYLDNLISDEMVLLAEKEKNIEPIAGGTAPDISSILLAIAPKAIYRAKPAIKCDHSEYKKVFAYIKKNKILFIFLKSKRFIEEIFIKVFGENAYLRIRCFFKNCLIVLIKKHRRYRK